MDLKTFAMAVGIVYALVGVLGFFPGFSQVPAAGAPDLVVSTGYGYFMGLFPINLLHNLTHLAIGIWGIIAARQFGSSRGFARGLAWFYGGLALMGLMPVLNTTFGLIPIFGHDIWLHAATAALAGYMGYVAPVATGMTTDTLRRAS